MADNIAITPGSGATIATDDVGGVQYQRVKVAHGADGSATDVSSAAPLPTVQQADTPSVTSVSAATSATTILAAAAGRRGASVYNDSTAVLYLKMGTAASTTSFTVKMGPAQLYEFPLPVYTGQVTGIWAAANGAARVTELT